MRITGGTHRGRILTGPPDRTIRPTADRARLAIFNMLLARGLIQDAMVIDAFCGTGALGLEALSRGARGALLVDAHRTALDLARTNAQALGLTPICQFWQRDATRLDPRPAGQDPASLVFLDPPYHQNLVIPTLESLSNGDWLVQSGTTLVVETERDLTLTLPPGFHVVAQKSHGAATLTLLDWTVL